MKNILTFAFYLIAQTAVAQTHLADSLPDRIILNLTENPQNQQAVNWRTAIAVKEGQVAQLRKEDNSPDFSDIALRIFKPSTTVFSDKENHDAAYHSVLFDSLETGHTYNYRVGKEGSWSEWFQFTTATTKDSLTFIYMGDAQNDLRSRWTRVYRKAIQTAPQASFILHAGDLINRSNTDAEWDEWFYAGNGINSSYPQGMIPGNHEYFRDDKKNLTLDPHWQQQFNLPRNGISGLEESNYTVNYGPVRIIGLNTQIIMLDSAGRKSQAEWLENILRSNKQKWTFVLCHHPIYSTSKSRDNFQFAELFNPIFEKYGVDMLLQGHDHTYARSALPKKEKKTPVYVVSVAGPKMYKLDPEKNWIEKSATNTQLFQVIEIKGNKLIFSAYTANGQLYDRFELEK